MMVITKPSFIDPHYLNIVRKSTKKPSVYPMEIVEIECPADAEIILPIYV